MDNFLQKKYAYTFVRSFTLFQQDVLLQMTALNTNFNIHTYIVIGTRICGLNHINQISDSFPQI